MIITWEGVVIFVSVSAFLIGLYYFTQFRKNEERLRELERKLEVLS